MKKLKSHQLASFFLFVWIFAWALEGLACPCGCGALGPNTLEPGQTAMLRFYGQSEQTVDAIDANRRVQKNLGPEANARFGLSSTIALVKQWSAFLDVGLSDNYHSSVGDNYSPADPSLGLRWQAESMGAGIGVLNLGLFSTLKMPVSKGLDEAPEEEYGLDIHGNGTLENLSGVQAEWTDFRYGVALTEGLISRLPKRMEDGSRRIYGLGLQSNLLVYYAFPGMARLQAALLREERLRDRLDSETLYESGALSHTLELGTQIRVGAGKTLGLFAARRGLVSIDRNSYLQNKLSLSYSQTF